MQRGVSPDPDRSEGCCTAGKKTLASGTTWAASGLVGQLWANKPLTKLAKYGSELYAGLEEKTGQATGWTKSGSIRVAQTSGREKEFDRAMDIANAFDIPMEKISLDRAKSMFPLLCTDDLLAAWYQPDDGYTNPEDTTQAMAKGARMGGAVIVENILFTGIQRQNGVIVGIKTDQGEIACKKIVLCTGIWSRELGARIGVSIPLHAAEHMHMTTTPMDGVVPGMPYIRDMDGTIYIKEETGGLLFGSFEPVAVPWGRKGIPDDFAHTELQENMDLIELFMESAVKRVPALADAEMSSITTVPESFTPDTAYMLGEVPGMKNLFVAAGMNSVGIASAGGVGKALAHWIDLGYPEEDLWPVYVRRFHAWQGNPNYVHDRFVEAVGVLYADHFPFRQRKTARNVRQSAFHDRLKDRDACFGVVGGWERANWFATKGIRAEYEYSWGRQNWFDISRSEHMAVREGVGVYDLTSMAEFLVQGRDACESLQMICTNNIDVPAGKVVYTQLLNERGGIESDLTVTRLDEDRFFIVAVGATATRDFDWIDRHLDYSKRVTLTDVGSGYSMLGVMGPKSRGLLADLTDTDLSNESFPFATARYLDIGYARPLAIRMSYVGELGWELYIPTEFFLNVFDALMEAGEKHGLRLVGLHALDSLRLEKSYKHWGSDITPDDTPFQAGLGFCVNLDKGGFIGRDALLRQKEKGISRKLVTFTVDDPDPLIYRDEPIYRNGIHVSENTHGSYSHLFGGAIGMTYLSHPDGISNAWIEEGKYEVGIEGKRYPVKIHLKPPYDPEGRRVKM
jgi:glycine cleavage system aminomethyltransferase T/glycine/D-amino acid oxidase-like deaminating enzyme